MKFFANPKNKEALAKAEDIIEDVVEQIAPQLRIEVEMVEAAINTIENFATNYEAEHSNSTEPSENKETSVVENVTPKTDNTSQPVPTYHI